MEGTTTQNLNQDPVMVEIKNCKKVKYFENGIKHTILNLPFSCKKVNYDDIVKKTIQSGDSKISQGDGIPKNCSQIS